MSIFRYFTTADDEDTGEEVVMTLVERLDPSNPVEDRCDAMKGLIGLSQNYRIAVATYGMQYYVEALRTQEDEQYVHLSLTLLAKVLDENDDIGLGLAKRLLADPTFFRAAFACMDLPDFQVKHGVLILLHNLLRHCFQIVQEQIVAIPLALPIIVDLLKENYERLRNDAVLVTTQLCRGNADIKDVLVFHGILQIVLDIIELEPLDSIVIEDCLYIVFSLVRRSQKAREVFRDVSLMKRLTEATQRFLYSEEGESILNTWEQQQTANFLFILRIIRLLSAKGNFQMSDHVAQQLFLQAGMLDLITRFLLTDDNVNMNVLSDTAETLGFMIRGHASSQDFFVNASLGEDGGLGMLLMLSRCIFTSPFLGVRNSTFFCLTSYLANNSKGKARFIDTLLPQDDAPVVADTSNVGLLTTMYLFSEDYINVYHAALILLHAIIDDHDLQLNLLRVQLSAADSEGTSSLLEHVSRILITPRRGDYATSSPQIYGHIGLLMLLVVWLNDCVEAVNAFLSIEDIVTFFNENMLDCTMEMTEDESTVYRGLLAVIVVTCYRQSELLEPENKDKVNMLVNHRLGVNCIATSLSGFFKSKDFILADCLTRNMADSLLDYSLCALITRQKATYLQSISVEPTDAPVEASAEHIKEIKNEIRKQDLEIARLTRELNQRKATLAATVAQQKAKNEETRAVLQRIAEKVELYLQANPGGMQPVVEYVKSGVTECRNILAYYYGAIQNGTVTPEQVDSVLTELGTNLTQVYYTFGSAYAPLALLMNDINEELNKARGQSGSSDSQNPPDTTVQAPVESSKTALVPSAPPEEHKYVHTNGEQQTISQSETNGLPASNDTVQLEPPTSLPTETGDSIADKMAQIGVNY